VYASECPSFCDRLRVRRDLYRGAFATRSGRRAWRVPDDPAQGKSSRRHNDKQAEPKATASVCGDQSEHLKQTA